MVSLDSRFISLLHKKRRRQSISGGESCPLEKNIHMTEQMINPDGCLI